MKILLINPPTRTRIPADYPPLGLGYLAAWLRRDGHDAEILDFNRTRPGWEEIPSIFRERSFDVVGIGGIATAYSFNKALSKTSIISLT